MTGNRISSTRTAFCALIVFFLAFAPFAGSEGRDVFFRDDFIDLANWKPMFFPKINKHTIYTIDREGAESFLKAASDASASGLVLRKEFSVYEHPGARWRWKVSGVFPAADPRTKEGDDYPIRVYVLFRYDPAKATFGQRVRYGFAKAMYGEYPPHSSLSYVWAGKKPETSVYPNPFAGEAMMIALESGSEKAGQWVDEEVDILSDYRRAFGQDPPAGATLALMGDSDNTGGRGTAYIDFIEVFR